MVGISWCRGGFCVLLCPCQTSHKLSWKFCMANTTKFQSYAYRISWLCQCWWGSSSDWSTKCGKQKYFTQVFNAFSNNIHDFCSSLQQVPLLHILYYSNILYHIKDRMAMLLQSFCMHLLEWSVLPAVWWKDACMTDLVIFIFLLQFVT